MIQTPAIFLSLILASVYAVVFHLLKGRTLRDLLFLWLAAVIGFAAGQVAGQMLNFIPWTIGEVRIVEGTLVSVLFLIVARWLMQDKTT
jgi:hypothetical protein